MFSFLPANPLHLSEAFVHAALYRHANLVSHTLGKHVAIQQVHRLQLLEVEPDVSVLRSVGQGDVSSVEDSQVAPCSGAARTLHKLGVVIVVERQSAVVRLVLVHKVVGL